MPFAAVHESGYGTKRRDGAGLCLSNNDVRSGSKADLTAPKSNFRFTPESGLKSDIAPCPGSATSGLMHCIKWHRYSITSSARASRVGGISIPSILAVLRLMMNSNLVACMTGRSAGLAPLSILPT
jgi:hypothetical protein